MNNYIAIDMIMRDGTIITIKAPNSTLCIVQARIVYDSFEAEVWQSLRP